MELAIAVATGSTVRLTMCGIDKDVTGHPSSSISSDSQGEDVSKNRGKKGALEGKGNIDMPKGGLKGRQVKPEPGVRAVFHDGDRGILVR